MVYDKIPGTRIQLTEVDRELNERVIYPKSTIDDVMVDTSGKTLSEYIPTVDDSIDNPTISSPILAIENGIDDVDDVLLTKLMDV